MRAPSHKADPGAPTGNAATKAHDKRRGNRMKDNVAQADGAADQELSQHGLAGGRRWRPARERFNFSPPPDPIDGPAAVHRRARSHPNAASTNPGTCNGAGHGRHRTHNAPFWTPTVLQ